MSLIVPQIPVWVSFSEHVVKGHECQLAAVLSEVYALNSIPCCLGNSSINFIIWLLQPYYTGQLASRRVGKCRSSQDSLWGKYLHHRGERIWSGEFKWVLLLRQQPAAILTASGLPLLKARDFFDIGSPPFADAPVWSSSALVALHRPRSSGVMQVSPEIHLQP